MAHFHTNALIGASGADTGGDAAVATKSLRFNPTDSAYLSRTPSSAGNRRTWTVSLWLKRSKLGTNNQHVLETASSPEYSGLWFAQDDSLEFRGFNGSSYTYRLHTSQRFRDPSAWYHIVLNFDSTASTASDRLAMYVNGVKVTSFDNTVYPSQNHESNWNNTSAHYIATFVGSTNYYGGYIADLHSIDGSILGPTSFGAFDSNGLWKASVFSGSHGTNGFHLKFDDSSSNAALGKDSSGNNNTFTVNNLSAAGQVASSAAVLNLPLNSTPFADSSASSATVTNTGSISTTFAASNTFNISTVASLNGSSQRLTTNNNNISFQGDWTVDGYFIIDNGSSGYNALFNSGYGSQTSNYMYIGFDNTNKPYVETSSSGSRTTASNAISKNVWYHIRVIQTGGTITLYINGTSYLTKTAQTTDLSSQGSNTIGSFLDNANNANNFFGQLGPFRIINDALDAPPSGGAATNSGALSNTGTKTDAAAIDSLFDVPTNGDQSDTGAGGEVSGNYATLNALNKGSNITLKEGNLELTSSSHSTVLSTIAVTAGMKTYMETTVVTDGVNGWGLTINPQAESGYSTTSGKWWVYDNGVNFSIQNQSTSTPYGVRVNVGDILQLAIDYDAGKAFVGINNTWINSTNGTNGNPSTGANPTFTFSTTDPIFPLVHLHSGELAVNFGQRAWAYSAPTNFKALCTTNLPTPTIADGSDYFDTKLYTGNYSSQSITGLEFSPDFIWIKDRSASNDHNLYDIVRGANKKLVSNSTAAEGTVTNVLNSFDASGFSIGDSGQINSNNNSYAAWAWNAGASTVSNTDGNRTCNVRANPSAGFSIVSWNGNRSSGTTLGHGLNAAPELIIIKNRDVSTNWMVYHKATGHGGYLGLNMTAAFASASSVWSNTAPTNTVFTVGADTESNGNGNDMIAYCFTSVAGYSKIGSFINPTSSDGAFVFCGFRPAFLLAKCAVNISSSSGTGDWILKDSARSHFNDPSDGNTLVANVNNAEDGYYSATQASVDFLSNGFKIRHPNSSPLGDTGRRYVYIAFAENPFQANGGLAR